MDAFYAVELIECGEDVSTEEYVAAWQFLIDSGIAWQLQGFYGRTAARLIEDGICTQ